MYIIKILKGHSSTSPWEGYIHPEQLAHLSKSMTKKIFPSATKEMNICNHKSFYYVIRNLLEDDSEVF